jgi:hypothetical protein
MISDNILVSIIIFNNFSMVLEVKEPIKAQQIHGLTIRMSSLKRRYYMIQ